MRMLKLFAILCAAWGYVGSLAQAQAVEKIGVLTTLYSFCADNPCVGGVYNYNAGGGTLVQASNGALYGTTEGGGAYGHGTVFGITKDGKLITLYSFSGGSDGGVPWFGLVLATDGNLYGVTTSGGVSNNGTIFKITQVGKLTTLYRFGSEYSAPTIYAALVQAADGDLYGVTRTGGTSGNGTVFKITLSGRLTTLYSFSGGLDGAVPQAPLVQATNGDLYGTTYSDGAYGDGTIFKITPSGTLSVLDSFDGSDGGASQAGLIQATDGDLYGTGKFGGTYGGGSVYRLTPTGKLTTLYSFSGGADGSGPNSVLIQATDSNFYGTTEGGGTYGTGTIFKISPSGKQTTLYEFSSAYSGPGNSIYAGLFQATNGDLYGTTQYGGSADDGTFFSFSVGLGPLVETLPTSSETGAEIRILGDHLENSTRVTFNGKAATFIVFSGTEISATVPPGATTGTVQVTTPSGVLSSNKPFTVRE